MFLGFLERRYVRVSARESVPAGTVSHEADGYVSFVPISARYC